MSGFCSAAVCLFVREVPAHLAAYYPFRNRLRFPLWAGFGTGTWTVRKVAERCGGTAKFTYADGVFYALVFLYD